MTPKELHDELKRLETAAGGTEVYDDSHLRYALRNNLPTILRALSALSGLEVARVAMENAREQLWHLAKDKENNPWVKELESALSQLEAAG